MSCGDKIKQNCKKVFGACVSYFGSIPDYSELATSECTTIEEIAQDLYENITIVKDEIDLSELENNCLVLPVELEVKSVIQFLIDTICEDRQAITDLQDQLSSLDARVTDIETNTCP